MLNIVEMSDIGKFIETIEDERIRDLLRIMHFEYQEYMDIGEIGVVCNMKKLMDVPMSQVARAMNNAVDCYREEMGSLRKENEYLKNIKKRRPYKENKND